MALIPSGRVKERWSTDDSGLKVAVYEVFEVDTGDTIDLSDDFNEISEATGFSMGMNGYVTSVFTTIDAVTLVLTGMANDNVLFMVKGQAAE